MKKLAFLLLFLPLMVHADNGNDSLKQGKKRESRYPLDDPRNPDCPCHELQKKADEEYRRQLEIEKREAGSGNPVAAPGKTKRNFTFGRKVTKGKHSRHHAFKRKKVKDLLDDCPDF